MKNKQTAVEWLRQELWEKFKFSSSVNNIFEKASSAFAPKPDDLLYVPTYIEKPKPLDPKYSYATRTMTVAGGLTLSH
jgi:hypothetical protein